LPHRNQSGKETYDPADGPRQVSRWRELPWYHRSYLESARELDFRDLAAMPRDGSGGAGFWVFQNVYGPDKQVLPYTIFSTPEIVIRSPLFRRWPALPPDPGKLEKGKDAQWFFFLCPALPRMDRPFAVEFDVLHLPELPLSEVAVFLVKPNPKNVYRSGYRPTGKELQEIYRADKPPPSGQLRVDPAELAPGIYGLCVEAADRRGIRAAQLTYFEVPANRAPQ